MWGGARGKGREIGWMVGWTGHEMGDTSKREGGGGRHAFTHGDSIICYSVNLAANKHFGKEPYFKFHGK